MTNADKLRKFMRNCNKFVGYGDTGEKNGHDVPPDYPIQQALFCDESIKNSPLGEDELNMLSAKQSICRTGNGLTITLIFNLGKR